MEEKKVQRELMSEEEFKEYIEKGRGLMPLHLYYFAAVGQFKSVRRAIRRGLCTPEGIIMPTRPFNNRGNSCKRKKHSRAMNEEKKRIYARITEYRNRTTED